MALTLKKVKALCETVSLCFALFQQTALLHPPTCMCVNDHMNKKRDTLGWVAAILIVDKQFKVHVHLVVGL